MLLGASIGIHIDYVRSLSKKDLDEMVYLELTNKMYEHIKESMDVQVGADIHPEHKEFRGFLAILSPEEYDRLKMIEKQYNTLSAFRI